MSPVMRSTELQRSSPLGRLPGRVLSLRDAGVILAVAAVLLVTGFVLWYTSSGLFPAFPRIQNDYVDLGMSFLQGELSLHEVPDPRLAALGDPYEHTQRKEIPYHWDASYYEGKYYLYWGPAPALVSAALQAIIGSPPAASLLVDIAYIGLMCVAMGLLFQIARAFGTASRLTVWLFILIGFFNLPMLFTIGQPRHYQASIVYGQFFLLGGLLGLLLHARTRQAIWLIIGGLGWGLAFASRYNLAISVLIYLSFAVAWLWRDRAAASFWRRLVMLASPLAVCVIALGIYNQARFGDPLETGLAYQLTIPEFRQISYSTAYVRSGLYVYLIYPLTGTETFPFIGSAHFRPAMLPDSLFIPAGREFDQIAFGLIPTVPAIWLLTLAILLVPVMLPDRTRRPIPPASGLGPGLVFAMLAAGAAAQFAFLLVFFYVAERYLIDFYVPIVLCLSIIVWRAHAALQRKRYVQIVLWSLVFCLMIWTAAIGYFACFGVPVLVSLTYDPQMLAGLATFWNQVHETLQLLMRGSS